METFATLVEQGRAATGLSYQRIADLVGRAPSTIRSWERGRSEPNDPEVVAALAAVLDISEDTLLESVGLTRSVDSIGGKIEDIAEPEALSSEIKPALDSEPDSALPPPVHVQMDEPDLEAAQPSLEQAQEEEVAAAVPSSDEPIEEPIPKPRVSLRRVETHRTAIPPQPMLLPAPQRSYLEDRRQMTTYRIRALLTLAILVGLLLLVEWGLHGAGLSLKEALSGLHP
jgi:transcriptional regulator with XRE-family HTH domain